MDATGKPYVAGGRYGLYFRKRLDSPAPVTHRQAEAVEPASIEPRLIETSPSTPPSTSTSRWWLAIFVALAVFLVLGTILARM